MEKRFINESRVKIPGLRAFDRAEQKAWIERERRELAVTHEQVLEELALEAK